MSKSAPQPVQRFFCFGPPKSGTTLLQRALNLHPQVSCPSEIDCRPLYDGLKQLFEWYSNKLRLADRRTGGEGSSALAGGACLNPVFRAVVETMMLTAANGAPIVGVKDNNIITNPEFFNDLFDQPKLIAIFRNPIDQGLSAWHHNLRLAREENDPCHAQLIAQFGGLDGWLRQIAQMFIQNVARWCAFAAGRDNVHTVCYEDLVTNRMAVLSDIFSFLGADNDAATLHRIVDETDISRMRAESRNPGFFRAGAIDMGGDEITQELRRELEGMVAEPMQILGYVDIESTAGNSR